MILGLQIIIQGTKDLKDITGEISPELQAETELIEKYVTR